MSRPEITHDPRVVATLHRAGAVWRALAGARTNGSWRVLDAREFGVDQAEHLQTWLDQHQVSRVICILPASSVICRSTQLPAADDAQLASALQIQVETYLPDAAPAHRLATAILPPAEGESVRSGLIVAWPQRAEGPVAPVDRPVTYAPDVAALAALINGERTAEVAMWLDRSDGSIALAMPHAQGLAFRAAREAAVVPDAWKAGVRRLLTESAFSAGHTEDYIEALLEEIGPRLDALPVDEADLVLPPAIRRSARKRLSGAGDDAAWWSRYGIAAGALLLTSGELAPLAGLLRDAPIEQPGRFDRLLAMLSSRRAAAMWLATAAVILGFGPLAFSGARLFMLHQKVGDLDEFDHQKALRETRLRMYDALVQNTWPMSKLLADITNCAPSGLVFTSIDLNESNERFVVKGEADSQQPVLEMLEKLRETMIFEDLIHDFRHRDNARPEFTVSARVVSPYRMVKYDDDFAETTLAMRLYPNEFRRIRELQEQSVIRAPGGRTVASDSSAGAPTAPAGDESVDPRAELPPDVARQATDDDDEFDDGDAGDASTDAGAASDDAPMIELGRVGPRSVRPQANIPGLAQEDNGQRRGPALPPKREPEDLRAMDRPALISAMAHVNNALRLPNLSDDDRKMLQEQFALLRQYLNELPR